MNNRCLVKGCSKDRGNRKTYCEAHYYRLRRTGSLGKFPIEIREKHGKVKTIEYRAWSSMNGRCHNPDNKRWEYYGGRGITVCKSWRNSFSNFLADMGLKPKPNMSLDRRNTNGNYTPGNCRWATPQEQMGNRRTCRVIKFRNQSKTLAGWSRETGIKRETIAARLNHGWSTEKALSLRPGISNI